MVEKKYIKINMGWRYIGLICILLLGIFPGPSLAESTNVVLNPGFEPGTASWLFYTNGAGRFLNDVPGATSPSAGHITISLEGTNVQLYQAGLVLEPNTRYNMSFKAYSNTGHDLLVSIFKHGTPYTNYGLSEYAVNLGTSWTDYSIQFTTSGFSGTVNDARLMFMLVPYETSGDEYFFDDVVISKFSSYTPPPPVTPPTITSQPSSRTVITGQEAAFSVTATGTAPLGYQWKKDGVNISSATGPSYTTPVTSLADNGTKFSVVVSNLYGSITSNEVTLSVIDTPSVQWWDTARRFRVPVTVGSTAFERYEKPVDVSVNFTRVLNGFGQTGAFDENSLRVVETDSTGIILDDMVPFQFDKDTGYDAAGKASGTIVFIMKSTTQPNMIRYYHIYFDTAGGSFTPLPVTPLITLTDYVNDEGQSSYRIAANGSTYYYQKAAGGFSSLVDSSGNDWISYAPVVGSAEYRGIPNVYSGGIFHPGFTCCTSSIVTQGPIKASVRSVSPAGWESRWDFYPGYTTMTMVRAPAGYYFLYEGTPGGALEPNSDFMVRSDGTQNLLSQSWNVDIPNNEWAYFSDPNVARSFFAAHHEDDTLLDTYWPYNTNILTVFGFGRTDYPATGWLPYAVPQHFTIGLMNGTGFTQNSKIIYSAYKDLAISTSMAEQYNNILPPAIVTQPADKNVQEGQTATFSVVASGASPLAYQWQKNGVDIQDANLATYTTPAITSADDGDRFQVVVSNILGSVTSNEAILTVDVSTPPPPPANQLVLLDATFEHNTTVSLLPPLNAITGKSATFFNIPPNVPDNLVSPIDYAHGTIYQRLEVVTKPSTKTVWYQICIFQDEITTLRHACTFREQLAFNSPGIYYQSQPFSTVFQYYNNDWSRKLLIYMLTMTDTNHVLIDDRPGYNFGNQWIGYPDMTLYYPMKVRYTAILIPSGGGQPVWPSDQVVSRPQVVTKAPTGTNVPVASRIYVNFSKAMNKTSVESSFSTLPAITGSFSWSGNNMTYIPVSNLAYNTIYKVSVGTGAKDLTGNNMSSKYEWQFTTKDQDLTPPAVIGNSPTGTDVSRAAKISVTFSEEMNRSSAQSAFSTLPDTTGGSFSWNGNMMTYTPATNLAYSTTYTVTVGTGAMDISGNTLSSPNLSQFTTKDQDLTPPAVIEYSPAGTGVPIASKVIVTFSEEMNTSSVQSAFSIFPAIAGSFSWSGDMMTYTPVSNLAYNTAYIVTVGTGAMDISGNNLPSPNVSQFITIPDLTPPSVTGNTPTGTNVPVISSITVNFSEAMDIASVESAFFTLPDTTGGSFSWSGNTMRYTPPANSYNTTYSVRIATGAKDLAGNNLPAEFVWQFTTAPLSINVLSNAGFESGTASWLFYTSGTGAFSVISPGYEGNAARLALSSGGTNIQLFQTGITVEPNTRYRLSFTAYSTTGHDVTVRLFKHGSPYTAYSPEFTINLGTSWQTFTTEFTSSGITGTVKDGRLMFQVSPFAAAGDIYYLDNIKLEKV